MTISIADTGPGIPDDLRDRLFEPFVSRKPGGTGLGLSIVRKLVEEHNGLIKLADARGPGATFVISLPTQAELAQ